MVKHSLFRTPYVGKAKVWKSRVAHIYMLSATVSAPIDLHR